MSEKTVSPSTGWVVTLAGVCINLALGVLYTWSIFTAKFTTVVTYGVNGAVAKAGDAGAVAIKASEAAAYGIKVPDVAAGKPPYGDFDFVGQLDKVTGVYKVSKVSAKAFAEGAFNWAGADALLPYALALLFFGLTMSFAGRLQDKYGPRLVASVGGVLVGLGMISASFAEFTPAGNHLPLIGGFGVLTGMGIGLAYACATPAAVKWFHPSKRGLIAGLVVAGFGLASVYTAPTTTALIASSGLSGTFRTLGIAFLVAIVLFAQLLKNPPAGYEPPVPANFKPPKAAAAAVALKRVDYTWQQMVKTPQFYLLWVMYAFAAFAGLMMIGVIAKVAPLQLSAADMAKMALTGVLAGASLLVVALAIGNGLGRPVFGIVSDKIGRVPSMIIAFLAQAALVGFLLPNAHSLNLLLLWSALIGAMYGACLTLFPAATYDFFGTKNGGVNYGIIFSAWGVGGALGNYAIGWIYDLSGKTSFNNAYYLAAGLLVVAAVLAVTVKPPHHTDEALEAA